MEWTEEFREEMRDGQLRASKVLLILICITLPLGLPFYYYLFLVKKMMGIGGIYEYLLLVYMICMCSGYFIFHFILKKTKWIHLTTWIYLLWNAINFTFWGYLTGAPFFNSVVIYPVAIVFASIFAHPKIATRFFVVVALLLGALTLLLTKQIIPFFPVLKMTPFHSSIVEIFINSDFVGFNMIIVCFVIIFTNLYVLLSTNFIVNRLRKRENELSISNQRISRLSEKLKVYLPHQFVESLAHGDRDTLPDYRRRRLTIFFSDVQGFTNWTDKLEPEEVREILNHYLSEMSDIAHKHGGTIDKFIGDCLMIFFGDPEFTNDKDHALRCVRMAMEMQEKMRSLRNKWRDVGYEEPLRIRVGIHTGYATVGNFGSEDRLNYTALGSAVNLASRLESNCRPDHITISHTTYSLIKDEIDCEPKGEIEVKGFPEPVRIYEVEGFKSGI